MKTRLPALALALVAVPLCAMPYAMAGDDVRPVQRLDVSDVTTLRIVGEATAISVTTVEGEPLEATLDGRRTGWFAKWYSSWFYNDCRTSSRMEIEGKTLTLDARPPASLEPSNCQVALTANVRGGTAIVVEQAASQVRLSGDFSTVALDAKAADVALDGHAASVRLSGDALRSRLDFSRTDGNETIAISAHALDASLSFPPGTRISYGVDAVAAMLDSSRPNTPGAKPSISITGAYARVAIR